MMIKTWRRTWRFNFFIIIGRCNNNNPLLLLLAINLLRCLPAVGLFFLFYGANKMCFTSRNLVLLLDYLIPFQSPHGH